MSLRGISCASVLMTSQIFVIAGPLDLGTANPEGWRFGTQLEQLAIGLNLPVMALERANWADFMTDHSNEGRAYSNIKAEIFALHSSGWKVGVFRRAQVQLYANSDAKNFAALLSLKKDPVTNQEFSILAHGQSWQGDGLSLASPWVSLSNKGMWSIQGILSLMQLNEFSSENIAGIAQYKGNRTYSLDLHNQSTNKNITGIFLPNAGQVGTGESISFALQGYPLRDVHLLVEANDLDSTLHWSQMAMDSKVVNSTITKRASDGTLDYGPLIKGRKSLHYQESSIGAHWKTCVTWSPFEQARYPVEFNLQVSTVADIEQSWIGVTYFGGTDMVTNRWALSYEPNWHTYKLAVTRSNFEFVVATDGKGIASQNQELQFKWNTTY